MWVVLFTIFAQVLDRRFPRDGKFPLLSPFLYEPYYSLSFCSPRPALFSVLVL